MSDPDLARRMRELAADLRARADLIDPPAELVHDEINLDAETANIVVAIHLQHRRPDGTWACRCGWTQTKPHHEHVVDMLDAAATEGA